EKEAGLTGATSGGANLTSRGKTSWNGQVEGQDDRGGRLLAGSLSANRNTGDGRSVRQRVAPSGATILDASSRSENESKGASMSGLYESPVLGGKLRLNGQLTYTESGSSSDEEQLIPGGQQISINDGKVTSGELGLRYTRNIAGI